MESMLQQLFTGSVIYHFTFISSSIPNKLLEGSCRANSLSEARDKYMSYLREYSYKDIVIIDITF